MSIGDSARRSRRRLDLRTYIAGGAATAALIVGVLIVFGSLAAYVGFNGLPVGGDDPGSEDVVVQAEARTASASAARDLDRAPGSAESRSAGDRAGGGDRAGRARAAAPVGRQPSASATPQAPSTQPPAVPGEIVPGAPEPTAPSPPTTSSPAAGPVSNAVEQIGGSTGVPLHEVTAPITEPVDEVVSGALSGVGQAVGPQGGPGLLGGD